MMNKIFTDLKKNMKSLYPNDKVITVNKFLLHSLSYPEVRGIISKYKGDPTKLQKDLFEHINIYEPYIGSGNGTNTGTSSSSIDSLGDFFDDVVGISQDSDVLYLFKLAENFEYTRVQKIYQETGSVPNMSDISVNSFVRSIIELAKTEKKYTYLYIIIKDSKFDVEKFIKDDSTGKVKAKGIIDETCTNMNRKASEGKLLPVIGRDIEVEQLIHILKKARKNNPVLVGKAGVGKTAIVEGLARKIVEGSVPSSLKNAVIYELRIMDIVKGTSYRGQFEQKMSELLEEFKELEKSGEMPILFIDELHTIMGAGSTGNGSLDFSNIIKPALARGELRTIGSTTTDEWYKFIKENPALDRRFISVTIKEPSEEESFKIIKDSIFYYENYHYVTYVDATIRRAIELSQQFIVDNALPDKAFDLIDFAGSMCSIKNKPSVEVEDVEEALSKHKNIDINAIKNSRSVSTVPLSDRIKTSIFGQDEAVDKVSNAAEKALAGLNDKNKPYGAFLFTGSTGTGKTELSKQLAKNINANFYRLDMSEYQEAHSVAKLLGSPAGYIGYDEGSSLTKIINEHPRTVLLLDEIEKAHPNIFKLLLQIMDHGKLTDSKGKEINFRNVIIIMTSNAGVTPKSNPLGLGRSYEKAYEVNKKEIDKIFPPEFRARLTGNAPIEFNELSRPMLMKIIDKYIDEIQEQRLDKINIKLSLEQNVVEHLIELSFTKNLGARTIKEFIESEIIDKLTKKILYGELKDLTSTKIVHVIIDNGKISLSYSVE